MRPLDGASRLVGDVHRDGVGFRPCPRESQVDLVGSLRAQGERHARQPQEAEQFRRFVHNGVFYGWLYVCIFHPSCVRLVWLRDKCSWLCLNSQPGG